MNLTIPELSLIVLIGPSGSGKSTFAAKHFLPTEIVSSDECRGLVSDDPNHQEATGDAFADLQYIAGKRLARGKLTVIDATNVQEEARRPLVQLAGGSLLQATHHQTVNLSDPSSIDAATGWWETLTSAGGEGMVVKPLQFVAKSDRGLVQPAVKCRGREYLRIIYGPHYTHPQNLQQLRSRGLGAKRSLAIREFAMGLESLERFVAHEPLHRVHECVFGVLALESEPVDPRL